MLRMITTQRSVDGYGNNWSNHFEFSFAVLMEEMSILRIDPQSCNTVFATSSEIMLAFCAISIQYSVS